jgi:hypothetical protein
MYGPDTHPSPLWDHPDFEHVGWMHQNQIENADLKNANHLVRDISGVSSFAADDYRPAFAKKGGHGIVAVHHDPDVGSSLAYFPHDKSKRPMLWTVADNPDGSNVDIMSSSGSGWQTHHEQDRFDREYRGPNRKVREPFKHSSPAILKEIGGIVNLHHPNQVFKGMRVTGTAMMLANQPGRTSLPVRQFDFSKFSAEDIERYFLEVYGHDYRIYHRPPGPEHGAPLHDLTVVYPDDVYTHPHYYHGQRPASAADRESTAAFMAARGNPEHSVKIYRAVPKHVTEINPGDWVTTSPSYARLHAGNKSEGFHVLEATARAGDLHTDGNSLAEFGYNGQGMIKAKVRR